MDNKSVSVIRTRVSRLVAPAGDAMQSGTTHKSAETAPLCNVCGDTGWKQVVVDGESRVTRCDCFYQSRSEVLLTKSSIPARYQECEFSTYRTDNNKVLEFAKGAIKRWAEQYPVSRVGLLIAGDPGLGKTHLAVSALKQLARKGVYCLFCDYRELLKQIQNSYNPSVQAGELEILQPVLETEVLLLDDLGAVRPSQWVWDTVSLVLNARYNANRTTIITTNFTDLPAASTSLTVVQSVARKETLGDRIGDRMRSRLAEMCRLVVLDGDDYRQRFRLPR